jgi:hypothetical protein
MFAALRFHISIPPVMRVGILQNFSRSLFVKVKTMRSTLGTKWKWALLSLLAAAFVFAPGAAHSQGSEWWRQYKAQCRARGGTICDFYNDCKGVCTMSPPFMTITDSIPFIEKSFHEENGRPDQQVHRRA